MPKIEVRDFFLAAYLVAEGHALVEHAIDPSGDRSTERFLFLDEPAVGDLIAAYEADRAAINPKAFARAIMTLRKRPRG